LAFVPFYASSSAGFVITIIVRRTGKDRKEILLPAFRPPPHTRTPAYDPTRPTPIAPDRRIPDRRSYKNARPRPSSASRWGSDSAATPPPNSSSKCRYRETDIVRWFRSGEQGERERWGGWMGWGYVSFRCVALRCVSALVTGWRVNLDLTSRAKPGGRRLTANGQCGGVDAAGMGHGPTKTGRMMGRR
jgi:hypothetical protein